MSYSSRMPVLADGYSAVPPGKIVSIVTELDMREKPSWTAAAPPGFALQRIDAAGAGRHLAMFRAVGEPWFWFSRARMGAAELATILDDPAVQSFIVTRAGLDVGLLEIDGRMGGAVELSFIGLVAEAKGQGAGRWLVGEGIRRAFANGPTRFWVHTCSLDDPRALGFYRACGFSARAQSVEVADDPRLVGEMARDLRPDVPIIEG